MDVKSASSTYQRWLERVEAQKRAAESDERSVEYSIAAVARAETALRAAMSEEKAAVQDAAHAAWH